MIICSVIFFQSVCMSQNKYMLPEIILNKGDTIYAFQNIVFSNQVFKKLTIPNDLLSELKKRNGYRKINNLNSTNSAFVYSFRNTKNISFVINGIIIKEPFKEISGIFINDIESIEYFNWVRNKDFEKNGKNKNSFSTIYLNIIKNESIRFKK